MLTENDKRRISTAIPALVERGRAGDENALGILSLIGKRRTSNERAAFSYQCALSYARSNGPSAAFGVEDNAAVRGIDWNALAEVNPLSVAIGLVEGWTQLKRLRLSSALTRLVLKYEKNLRRLRAGNLSSATLKWELECREVENGVSDDSARV